MEFINTYAPLFELVIAVGSVLTTLILLIFNIRANRNAQLAVREMRLAREQENRPYVIFDLALDENELSFVLRNDGRTEAYDLHLTIKEKFQVWNALVGDTIYHFDDMAISQPLDFLAPGDSFEEWMDHRPIFFRNVDLRHLTGKLTYRDGQGRPYELAIELNLEPYYRQSQLIRKDMGDLIQVLKRIQRHIERYP